MLTDIQDLRDALRTQVMGLDVDCIDGVAARNLVVVFAEIERIAAAGKMLPDGTRRCDGGLGEYG